MQDIDLDVFSSVLAEIYDCALKPEGWGAALTRVAEMTDSAYATISLLDLASNEAVMMAASPWDMAMLAKLNTEYGLQNPDEERRLPGAAEVVFGEVDEPRSTLQQMQEHTFQGSLFYQEWVRPQGLRDGCLVKFAHTPERIGLAAIVTRADRDIISARERRLMQLLSPHLRRAAMIGDLLNQTQMMVGRYRQTLEGLQVPVVLTDKAGRLVFGNTSALALLAEGTSLHLHEGTVAATALHAREVLADAVRRAGAGDLQLGTRGNGIPLSARQQEPVIAYVLPLTSGTLRGEADAAAAIFIASGRGAAQAPQHAVSALFDLTPAEARVMHALGSGQALPDVATSLGISENTVKSHLRLVFSKTGVSRQADLARLLASLGSPLNAPG